jgi:hypothetical protein
MEYADSIQQAITQIAASYQYDLNAPDLHFHLESPDGYILGVKRLNSDCLHIKRGERGEDGDVFRRVEYEIFTGQPRWVVLTSTVYESDRWIGAEVTVSGRNRKPDVEIVDVQGHAAMNAGCRFQAEDLRRIYLAPIEGVHFKAKGVQYKAIYRDSGQGVAPQPANLKVS